MKKEWIAGLYIRLSLEDGDDKEESNSVTNQREIIADFLKQFPDIRVYDTYVDDGYTGTNFERPSFKRLLQDWMAKNINTIIVKDLSRFGRNYLGVGSYIQEVFPSMQTRFIAINDRIDSYLKPESIYDIEVPFKNIMNEAYSKDISKKVKSVLALKQRDGEYVGSPPFGYIRNENNKKCLAIYPEEAKIVEKIFKWYLNGMSEYAIVLKLNKMNIPTKLTNIRNRRGDSNIPKNYWCVRTVDGILKNKVYIGHTISNKFEKVGNSRKHKRVPESKWKICKDTHPAIIKDKDFYEVQEKLAQNSIRYTNKNKVKKSIYANKLVCGDCGRAMLKMHSIYNWGKKVDNVYYYKCKTHILLNPMDCTPHCVKESELNKIILNAIKLHIKLGFDLEKIIKEVDSQNGKSQIGNIQNKLKTNIKNAKELIENEKKIKKQKYESLKSQKITVEEYKTLVEQSNLKISNFEKEIKMYEDNLSKLEIDDRTSDILINELKKYSEITELNEDIMNFFVKKIYIYEKKKVNIEFRLSDEFNKTMDYIKNVNKYLNILKDYTYE